MRYFTGAGYTEIAFLCLDLGPLMLLTAVLPAYALENKYCWIPSVVSLFCRFALLFSGVARRTRDALLLK